uniref:DNA-dependent protein kinase catalytic subunit n=1 Tax=Canis lupus familiaris TaxID=9615 RepID=PRKDC_CANLF|nr:RecName: Full=DNA-dependent protein kinase catalytic subunit; Short=DNA-PK catalytic subunit; Short=DNA-PKcs [Canis lupus familiaris]AAL40979.1 DNA-dependent protein kinase catalytic subunit [Canis lupus familiaris]
MFSSSQIPRVFLIPSRRELRLVLQLQESLSAGDRCSAAMASYQLTRGLGQECVLSSDPAVLALQTSLVFSKDFGLLVFVRKSLSIDEFRDCREEVLKFLYIFLEKIGQKITPYSLDIKTTCTSVYTKDKAAKCKIPALDLLIKLLQTLRSSRLMDEFSIGELFNKFYGELALKTKIQDTVLEKIYELLGVLAEVHPSEMINNSEKLFRAFLGELKIQMTSAIREPKLPVLAGCLKGLSSLMCNFTKSMEEDPQTSREIFDFALKAIRPQIDLKRYAVPLAGLCLFTLHASQFSTCLLDNYVSLFEVLSKWCSHTNVEMKKAAHSALESFLKQVSFMVAKDAEMHKSKLQYFMEQFYGIIRNMDSNSKDLSIAIRGYGLFAGPCKVINAKDVDFMYIELIQRCKQLFLTQIDTVDDHVYHMPSFLQSIASVLLYLDRVPEVYTPVLEHLMVAQIDSFPQYSPKMQSVCCKALVKVFLALGGKGPVLWNCISTVVHQGLIRICSKPVILQKGVESEPEEYRASGEVRTGKWKVPTYKDYLDLFRSLLSCDQMMDSLLADEAFLFVNSSLQNLNRLLYDEFVKSVLKIIEKLDLTLEKRNVGEHEDENEATGVWVIPTSDPAANLHPAKPKDFSAFINLVEFCRDILPEKHIEFFEPWVYSFAYELILQSTRLPLISGFYKLLSVAVRNAKKIKYFEGVGMKSQTQAPKDPEKYSCFALFAKFGKEVTVKMKQYKDELLASCLTFILSLPHDIIELDIRAYIPALQMAFKLGLSYTPLAEVGLNALEEWSVCICKHIIQPHYKDILPSLDGYLKTSALSDETKNSWEVSAPSQAAQKGFNQVVLKHLKKTKNISSNEALSLEEIRIRVVQMLGFLGGQINKNLLTATSSDEMMKKCVAWDREKRLSFAVPFIEMKPVIYLDVFLPRVTELALSASDRQTKVAACELLHSMVMFTLGKATQMPECGQGFPPMYQLYKRTFPALLRLACDVDQVTRQLYEPLVMQLIHWFTNNKKFESQDTVALLETILDGIVDPVDSTLRDFCGRCIREFLKWSIKQTTPQQQEKSPVNTKSLFKRLYSFALHPNAFKRLGASLAFNNIYREFREEESLVEQFVFEALVTYLESLALAHTDEKPLGTIRQCCDAIDHLRHIIEKKHVSLNKVKKRRRPRGFPPSASLCLLDMVQWLLAHCGRPQTECRHKSIELFYKFVPLLPGNKSPSLWLKDILKNKDTSFLINTFEGGGGSCDRPSGILVQPTLFHLQGPFSLRAALQWMDMLLAALECYNTFIEEKTLKAPDVLGTETQSSLWKAVAFFLDNIAMHDITAAEKCFGTGAAGHRPSPQEGERYNYSKCTIVVRIMEFTTTLLNTSPDGWKLLEEDLCNNKNFMTLLVKILCQPSSIGFNIGDVLVMNHLPDVCVNLMKALKKSPYKDTLEMCLKEKITVQSIEELCAVDLYGPDAYVDRATLASVVSACKQLHRAGVLHVVLPSQSADQRHSVGIKLLFLVYKSIAPGDEREYFPSLDPSCKRLASGLLELAFAFGGLCEHLVDLLLDTAVLSMPASGESQRNMVSFSHGEYFYSLFSEIINTELLRNLDMTVLKLMKSSVDNPKMVSAILNGMLDQSFRDRASRKQQGLKLASTILHNWKKWDSWWAKDSAPESKTAVLTLLAKILQIDSSVSFNTNHSAFPEVFTTYTSLLADSNLGLHLMGQAVILLPFFTNLTGGNLEDLEHVLEKLIVSNFPMKSEEFPVGTLRYSNYVDCMKKFLDALELSQSPVLLQLMAEILCREQQHVMEELFQSTFKKIARKSSCVTQLALLESVYRMFKRDDLLSNVTRQAFVDRSLLTLLWHCGLNALREFFGKIVVETIDVLKSRFTKLNESTFDTQITKKMGFYKMLDVMYSRLSKDDVHSKESKINQVFHGSCITEGNELTKTLIKLCYDAFTENMAGENQLLERRRLYHCAAYNCAISVICCVFTELKFYQGFLFSEKPEKNLLILENLIDLKRCYTFPIEVEVPMERRKKYIEIRKEAREAVNGDSDGPHYLSSLSYLADSSLSEEMSQFDFSTGVQSYSYGSQDPKSTHGHFRRREHKDPMVQDAVLELEMDELNQHECMATMTALIKHMQRNQILSKDEGSVPRNLPPWMKFLHDKLGNPSVSLNIRLFLAKLVINTEEVFRPYAKYWLSPLLQLVVSENNGGEGIHYMVVEIVVTVLSWTGLATPVGVPKDEVLANRLLHFLMEHVFHQKRAVFRHNLEIIKTLVECWKDCLSVPYRLIFEKFSSKDPNSKDNSVGIQLLGIVMANNLPPYDPKCGIERIKYFEALVSNMSFVKYKEVYAAAAEVLGLTLRYITERENILENVVYELVIKQLKQHQNTMEDKFIVCLNKVVKNFPPLADRFMNAVFFLLPKFHGVMKTLCLEVVLCRAEEITNIYLELKSKDFIQVMRHRDDERQKVCLDIIYKMMAKLKPVELRDLLNSVVEFISHPSPVCREQMYNILMWIHDNYRDPESQADDDSREVFKLAKDVLIQGLIDENAGLQLIIRNFWSHETRLPSNTLDRLLALNSLYSPKIEVHFLSLATDFLLEMTSLSPDYANPVFEHPLSECEFQEYTIDSDWRFRSTVLTPMFIETQASQSTLQTRTQERSLPAQGVMARQIRATQQQYDFTPTQTADGRSSFNWLTGSSIDPLVDYTVSSSDSSSSSLLFAQKRNEKSQRAPLKSVGPDFGEKKLGLPGDKVDNKAKGIDNRTEILRLRRRFIKDQEKLSLIYARKGIAEQKREKEIKSELKMKHDAQVILYRSYRQGDLPDIQIKYSSLVTPLQAVAQRDPVVAKQLFGSLFSGIIKEMDKYKTMSEKNNITQKLLQDFSHFLNSTFSFFPPFVSCIQEISCQHTDLLSLDPGSIRASCLASLQQPVGVRLLEEALLHLGPQEPPAKQFKGRMRVSPDVVRWMELAKLYRSIGEYDILRGIFSSEIGTKQITQSAIFAEARSDYSEAAKQYNEALNKEEWVDGEPTEAEKDFWELASLDCYNQLAEWKSLAYCSIVSVDNENPPDLNKMWSEPFYRETYLPYMIRSKLKLLLQGEADQSLLTFIDEAVNKDLQKALIELHYSQELSLLYILQDDIDRAKYYIENCIQIFMQNYSSIDVLLHRSRLTKLQSVQTMIEIQEFISFISRQGNLSSQAPLKRLLKSWTNRYPDARMDPVHIWDDIITNRCFFLSKIEEKLTLPLGDHSLSMDEERDSSDKMEVQEQGEEVCSLIKNCMFSMKMKMVESARKQHNFSLAMKLLKELRRESKTRDDWQVKWVHTYCRLSHSRIQGQSCLQQILSALKTVSLLAGESTSSYFSKNVLAFHDQNILLGTTYSIIANALRREPACLAEIEESRARRILDLSGSSLENAEKVIAVLYQRAFHHLSEAVRTAEEEAQPSLRGQGPVASLTDAYMTLADFCDQQLRKEEESASVTESVELQTYPGLVVDNMLKALKLHSSEARLKFPRLLQIIELYPEETLSLMTKEISSTPCWQFIGWISHMVALLDQEEAVAVQCTVEEIADNYPQAIVYPFIISSESYSFKDTSTGHKNKEFVARIKTKLDLGGVIQDFISALEQLSNPEMLFKDWTDDMKAELAKNPVSKKNIEKMYERMYAALGDLRAPGLGAFRRRFIQVFGKEFDKHFGKGGSKLPGMKLRDFGSITDSLFYKMCTDSKPPGNLKECSPWMSDFKVEFLRNELEIPGQYDGKGKPLPEYHARIAGFDERIKVMASIRKPKRIIIRGRDEKEYPLLVKGGEDLRQDQRIEQLFEVMNVLLSQDTACSQRNMQLKTYHVIPMTSRLGLIEWIENTLTLKDFLLSNMSREEKAAYTSDPKAPPCEYRDWLAKMSGKYDVGAYMSMFKAASRTETVTSFRRRESRVPADLLKRAFLKMSTGPAAFLALRSHFASSHALMCISHWILGIGDRHLNNFMVSMETGGLIGIDFGHAFGSATQFLPVPELMPFRLTRQFINLMLPMKEAGVVYSIMVHALRAFRSHSDLLTNTMDVFVKEPSFDWKNFEQKMLKKGGSWIQEINVTEKNWYPRQKIHYAKRKLAGANPAVITCDELFLGHEKALAFGDYVAVARGSKDHNIRAQQPENGLSEEAQVKCLIDQATDPNILGRTWIGWEPWM